MAVHRSVDLLPGRGESIEERFTTVQGINRYKADLREIEFVLLEQFRLGELLGKPPFEAWGVDELRMVLNETYRFAREVTGPLNSVGDQVGCKLENGEVKAPPGFKEAWRKLYEAGWKSLSIPEEHGGQGAPRTLQVVVEEFLSGSNTSFTMYPGLAYGAAEVIEHFGTDQQRSLYARRMFDGTWAGTMCLTEAHAGSDVGAATTSAKKNADGTYSIRGTKIFISGGDQDITDNIVHLVLARIEGAVAGTKGLSLFIVPKHRVNPDGTITERNGVTVPSIEHKMGINGSSTCVLNLGEDVECIGELVGTVEHQGIKQMFVMMNSARIAVGIQGLSIMSSAYLNAVDYAKDRKQGPHVSAWKDPNAPRVPIIQHPNVRRMLLDMKARVEGIRSLIVKLAMHGDRAILLKGKDDTAAGYHMGQVELLTPLVKAYATDQAFRVCESAIQVFGGHGYLRDHPVEQYCRDSKIFSIYEGTNGIQALDLVGRKLGQAGGRYTQEFLGDVSKFIEKHKAHPELGKSVAQLAAAHAAVGGTAMQFLGWFQAGEMELVPLNATRFLNMMSELAVGWLLLDGAAIALEKLATLPADHADRAFYEGKRHAAVFFAHQVLPSIPDQAQMIAAGDRSSLDISEASFTTV